MKIIDAGHRYELDNLKADGHQILDFYKDEEINGDGRDGCSCQEVIRALIDRVEFLEGQKKAKENPEIMFHLRKALLLFEVRALRLDIEDGMSIERFPVGPLGHWHK